MLLASLSLALAMHATPARFFFPCAEPKEPACIYPRDGKTERWFDSCKEEMLSYSDALNKYVECEKNRALEIYKDAAERFMCQAENRGSCLW